MELYIESLTNRVYRKIDSVLLNESGSDLFTQHFDNHLNDANFYNFQNYYFKTIKNFDLFLAKKDYMKEFRQKYSLRGIKNEYLTKLENDKEKIISLILAKEYENVYFTFFCNQTYSEKDYGSFFTKLIHTFAPEMFSPIDNPIKDYLRLTNESFFISMIVISKAYLKWANKNKKTITEFRNMFYKSNFVVGQKSPQPLITDLKILNIIFWSIANKITATNNV